MFAIVQSPVPKYHLAPKPNINSMFVVAPEEMVTKTVSPATARRCAVRTETKIKHEKENKSKLKKNKIRLDKLW